MLLHRTIMNESQIILGKLYTLLLVWIPLLQISLVNAHTFELTRTIFFIIATRWMQEKVRSGNFKLIQDGPV
ncbi:hypothetical protein BD770DRAFT_400765, partial [Pilaira anomala]